MNEDILKQKIQRWIVIVSVLILVGKFIAFYLTNSVGIGEHSNLLDEVEKHTEKLAEAEEKISVLTAHFGGDQ